MKKKTTLRIEIEYDDRKTDPEGLANAMDKMWGATFNCLYGPDCLKDYGNPKFGKFFPLPSTTLLSDVLPRDWNDCERGNTWLCDDLGRNHVAWIKMGEMFLKISVTPDNYPGLLVNLVERSEKEIAKFINKELVGWRVMKCNIEGVHTRRIAHRDVVGEKGKRK